MATGALGGIGAAASAEDEGIDEHDGDPNGLGLDLGLGLHGLEHDSVSKAGSQAPSAPAVQPSDVKAIETNLRDSLHSLEDRLLDRLEGMIGKSSGFQGRA